MPRHSNRPPWKTNRPPSKSKWRKRFKVNSKNTEKAREIAKALRIMANTEEQSRFYDHKTSRPFNLGSGKFEKFYDSTPKGRIKKWKQYLKGTYPARLMGFEPDPIKNPIGKFIFDQKTKLTTYDVAGATNEPKNISANILEVPIHPYVQKAANNAFKKSQSIRQAIVAARHAQKIVNKIYKDHQASSNYNSNGGSKRKNRTKRKKKTKKQKKYR